jgi:tRNA(Ile)-lysidine synthase
LELGYQPAVVHVNYHLRGAASQKDESLIERFCLRNQLKYHNLQCSLATEKKSGSIQVEARRIRYAFFEDCLRKYNYDFVLTAHHADDRIETALFNFVRGSGLSGMASIKEQRGKYLRPLIGVFREEIADYADRYLVPFRTDISNLDTESYSRNFLRHEVLPLLKELFPNYQMRMSRSIHNLHADHSLLNSLLEKQKEFILEHQEEYSSIPYEKLAKFSDPAFLLYHLLRNEGFHGNDILQIWEKRDSPGRFIETQQHRLYTDRNQFMLFEKAKLVKPDIKVLNEFPTDFQFGKYHIRASVHPPKKMSETKIHGSFMLTLNADKMRKPLLVRPWKNGDKFQPEELKGKSKKLKDYFTDKKIPLPLKFSIPILTTHTDEVLAVLPYSIDFNFKTEGNEAHWLYLEISTS